MVSGRRPLWIHRIKRRVSLNTFKINAKRLQERDENIRMVLKGRPLKHVYEVTVETMEDIDGDCFEDIWVPDEIAEATGEMLEQFEDKLEETESDEDELEPEKISEDVDREYEELCSVESFDPYADMPNDKDNTMELFSDDEEVAVTENNREERTTEKSR